jgi:RDD family
MAVIADSRDPRSIITPDAFEVSPDLLGLPLARPMPRLVAMVVDLAVIGLITLATKSFALLLGVVAAAFFVRAGFKRTPVRGSAFNRAMRLSVGCLGIFIAGVTAILWTVLGPSLHRSHDDDTASSTPAGQAVALADALGVLGGGAALRRADTPDEARDALRTLVERARSAGVGDSDLREALRSVMPEDQDWSDDADSILDAVLAEATPHQPGAPVAPAVVPPEVAAYSTKEALDAYARLLGAEDATSRAQRAALQARIVQDVAADTLRALQDRLDRSRRELDRLRAEAGNERKGGGMVAWIKNAVNGLGFGFGWASLYLTVMLSWWNGQTVGKRLMKIRVLRLDGEPITWWSAFERAGGYAAGFATGLLGFAQVYWDANRQCIHDRIVGTVVVRDGAPKVIDWESAL